MSLESPNAPGVDLRDLKAAARLAVLRATRLLDTAPEESFDRYSRLARRLLAGSAAFVSLVDAERVFFKSAVAATADEMPTEVAVVDSFCPFTVLQGGSLLVSDSRIDARFSGHRAVSDFNLIAYAGVPLIIDAQAIGTFCVIDDKPRVWTPTDVQLLNDLGNAVATEIALRQRISRHEQTEAFLQQAMNLLQEGARQKDHFLAMLAHELRNPLAPIRNGVEILRSKLGGDATLTSTHDMIDRQVTNLTRLVDDLLDMSRVSQGKISLRRERLDLVEATHAGIELARPLIDAKNQVLRVIVPPAGAVEVDGDPSRLAQVIGNLLNNAAKYSDPGEHIEIVVARRDGVAVLSVSDDGIGIDALMLPCMFELFVQAEQSLDRSQGGLGIGLALVRSLVEMHGGNVTARSDGIGKGSVFGIELPLLSPLRSSDESA